MYLIPIVALFIPIVAIVGVMLSRSRRDQLLHETIRQLSERGQPIPPELLNGTLHGIDTDPLSGLRPVSDHRIALLRGGAVTMAVGLGLIVMFLAMKPDSWLWAIGCVPLFIGVALFLVWRFESRQDGP